MSIIFSVKKQPIVEIKIFSGNRLIDETHLTSGQYFDILLIRSLDKIISKNKIERLSLKSVEISGKVDPSALSGMVLKSVAEALKA